MEIIAHRGAAFDAPENSIEAFNIAIDQGAQRLELDIQLTRDHVPVVHHDDTTGRVGDIDLPIEFSTLDELRAVRLPNGEEIATFDTLCRAVRGRVELDVELKATQPKVAEGILQTMDDHGLLEHSLITSFDPEVLRLVRHLGFKGATGLVVGSPSRNLRQRAYEAWPFATWAFAQATHLVIHHRLYHPLLRRHLNAHDGQLIFWMSMDDEARDPKKRQSYYRRIAQLKPDGIILSRIEEALPIFEAMTSGQLETDEPLRSGTLA